MILRPAIVPTTFISSHSINNRAIKFINDLRMSQWTVTTTMLLARTMLNRRPLVRLRVHASSQYTGAGGLGTSQKFNVHCGKNERKKTSFWIDKGPSI